MASVSEDKIISERLELLAVVSGEHFEIVRRLGSGAFGEVFLAKDIQTKTLCALKTERKDAKHPQLKIEQQIFARMKNYTGFPGSRALIETNDLVILAMDLLGPSLEDLLNFCQREFSRKTVLMLIDQAIRRIEDMHEQSIIHRDLKPDNFLMGIGQNANILYLIDFGLCKQYRDPNTLVHIPLVNRKSLTGTARYASIYTHQGLEQARRDDLESLMYILVYLSTGQLPWMGLKINDKRKKYEMIAMKKMNIPPKDLFASLPKEYLTIYNYIRSLNFNEKPDYSYIRSQIRSIFLQSNYKYDYVYDWYYFAKRMKHLLDHEK